MPRARPGASADAPARLLAASSSTPRMARVALQQLAPQLDRVLAGRVRQLVDEGLGRERGVAVPDRAPPQHRHADLGRVQLARRGSGSRRAASSAPSTEVASMPSLIIPSKGVPVRIDWPTIRCSQATILPAASRPAAQPMDEQRPIAAAADVVLARPHELHRLPGRRSPWRRWRPRGHVGHRRRAAAEAAAGQERVQLHLVGAQAERRRRPSPGRWSGSATRPRPRSGRR